MVAVVVVIVVVGVVTLVVVIVDVLTALLVGRVGQGLVAKSKVQFEKETRNLHSAGRSPSFSDLLTKCEDTIMGGILQCHNDTA